MSGLLSLRPERLRELSLFAVMAVAVLIFSLLIDNYIGGSFFNRVTTSVAITAVLAAGQTLVILTRNIDLSVGSIVASPPTSPASTSTTTRTSPRCSRSATR